ncbi:MAG TPA: glycosyltransferase family 9 protein [Nitrospirae bacterium]|nr:lipopolysaccharide core heptosyltransferase RfaQ [bacterium BMS3Abin06]HDH12371.1 glycosyltransferase family 9 protein [Nitrospirota bacterium]HDZ01253.1 glycosyltransferase family 9 protein [Nitrospirota bacterium]
MIYIILSYLLSPVIYLLIAIKGKRKINARILVIQTAKIGDLICSTPVFREVKRKFPDARLTVMVNPITEELLKHNPHVDEILTIKQTDYKGFSGKLRLSDLIRREKYDIAISLNPNVPFALALFWGLVPVRISVMPDFAGITFKSASLFFTCLEKHISGTLVIETYMKMLNAIGIKSNNISKEVYKSGNADRKAEQLLGDMDKPLIGIAVSSGNKLKELGSEKIAELANMLLDNMDINITFIGSAQERGTAAAILKSIRKNDRIIDATGRLSLTELPALIERLTLFIGVDTGITYMADAVKVPIIHIAGPIDVSEQRPVEKNIRIIRHKLSCVPCTYVFKAAYECKYGHRKCVNEVSMDEVFNCIRSSLKNACN